MSFTIEVVYPGHLSKRDIRFSFGAVLCVLYIEYTLLVILQMLILFATVSQEGGAKEIFTGYKPHSYGDAFAFLNNYLLTQHDVDHLVAVHVCLSEHGVLFRPAVSADLYFVKTFKIGAFSCYLIDTKSCKLNILGGDKTYSVVCLLVCDITELPLWRIHLFKTVEDLGGVYSTF